MAVVKFIASGCPMNNIFSYVMRDEATERKLIDGVNCMPETALEEFKFVKARFGKEDGRQYYHIIQSFSPDDNISPAEAHELGMKFAGHFEGFQAVVATHVNKAHLHNHIVLNSVNMETGRKYHQSRDEMLAAKRFANDLCREYGLSVTEEKCEYGKMPKWKQQLRSMIVWALFKSPDRETFIEALERHGYGVNWTDGHKYVTFTTPEGYKCRDNKLFDDRCLKCSMDIYFAMGGCASPAADDYLDFQTLPHRRNANMTIGNQLIFMMADIFRDRRKKTKEEIEQEERARNAEAAMGLLIAAVIVAAGRYRERYLEEQEQYRRWQSYQNSGPQLMM